MTRFRDATVADYIKIYGELPEYTMRAWIYEDDEKIYGIGGIVLKNGRNTAFLNILEKPPAKAAYRAITEGLSRMKALGLTILAVRDENEITSKRLLTKFGFEPVNYNDGQEIWEQTR